jgi:hypothetical protein
VHSKPNGAWGNGEMSETGDEMSLTKPEDCEHHPEVGKSLECEESAPGSGIFTRTYTKASVQTDCNTGVSSVCSTLTGRCLQPRSLVPLTTYFKAYEAAQWDHAPCATRNCRVYVAAGYAPPGPLGATITLTQHPSSRVNVIWPWGPVNSIEHAPRGVAARDAGGWIIFDSIRSCPEGQRKHETITKKAVPTKCPHGAWQR